MQKILLLTNPKAASGRSLKLIAEIRRAFAARQIETEVFQSEYAGHIEAYISTAELQGFDALVAVGGDGTLHELMNGLYRCPPENRKPLGLIPAGTGNAFARELGLESGQWQQAVDIIAQGRLREIDTARYRYAGETRYFINIISMGFGVDAARTAAKLKIFGNSAYTLGTLWQTLFLQSWRLKITLDGQVLNKAAVLASISNSRYTGTSFLIAPDAVIDDGFLDVMILEDISRVRILRLFPSIYSGKHIHYPEVNCLRGRQIKIETEKAKELTPDGEFNGFTPVEIECLHKDIQFIWP